MSTSELEFREIERELDLLIDAARPELETAGVVVTDQSYRRYHYDSCLFGSLASTFGDRATARMK